MVREGVHSSLPPALLEKSGDMPSNEEFRHRDERVEERTDAEDDQQNLQNLPAGRLRRRNRADGRNRVERPDKAVPDRRLLELGEAKRSNEKEERAGERRGGEG